MSGLATNNTGITESPSGARYGATDGPTLGNLSSQFHSLYLDSDDDGQRVLRRDSSAQTMTNTVHAPDFYLRSLGFQGYYALVGDSTYSAVRPV